MLQTRYLAVVHKFVLCRNTPVRHLRDRAKYIIAKIHAVNVGAAGCPGIVSTQVEGILLRKLLVACPRFAPAATGADTALCAQTKNIQI